MVTVVNVIKINIRSIVKNWGTVLVDKVLFAQAQGPQFEFLEPFLKLGVLTFPCNPSMGCAWGRQGQKDRQLILIGQPAQLDG